MRGSSRAAGQANLDRRILPQRPPLSRAGCREIGKRRLQRGLAAASAGSGLNLAAFGAENPAVLRRLGRVRRPSIAGRLGSPAGGGTVDEQARAIGTLDT